MAVEGEEAALVRPLLPSFSSVVAFTVLCVSPPCSSSDVRLCVHEQHRLVVVSIPLPSSALP
ncbi:DUF1722 domain-containing protein [Sesbania bispinosa]|nr:DUF1722 domain-containing protein [Sesbania bispinosa]